MSAKYLDLQTGELAAYPARPDRHHTWHWASKTWQPNLDKSKAEKRAQIERERDRRAAAPVIVYDGKNLDADVASIGRLANKLAALDAYEKRGQTMPGNRLVWRDADNVTHVFASHQDYKLWLAGFAIALDDRGTLAFAWSWEKKVQLDALETAQEVIDFDPTT
jgi:hypothetical protein